MARQRIAKEKLLACVSYLARSSVACQRIATEKLLARVSYLALKLYGMSEKRNKEISSLCLIPRFEAVWYARESQQRNC